MLTSLKIKNSNCTNCQIIYYNKLSNYLNSEVNTWYIFCY